MGAGGSSLVSPAANTAGSQPVSTPPEVTKGLLLLKGQRHMALGFVSF